MPAREGVRRRRARVEQPLALTGSTCGERVGPTLRRHPGRALRPTRGIRTTDDLFRNCRARLPLLSPDRGAVRSARLDGSPSAVPSAAPSCVRAGEPCDR
uniref:Uncharacterized protein n=1 Tax=Streptomyces ambofaciens (strain ATCC 23877 / 3486 / DSM 40053 / JCM 4204 / NBRC 12836 / NRRL B-2516) TaxID=278992 RepID=A3KJS1_STRA7|nr:hypothetical protein SAML0970 [Streptomyces ambofaciens ATCC 23877]